MNWFLPRVLNLHQSRTYNIGDLYSGPARYFPELRRVKVMDISHLEKIGRLAKHDYIIGGGGLIANDWFDRDMERVCTEGRRIVIWGAGINTHGSEALKYPDYLSRAGLIGMRDYASGHEWVPCASCMAPELDRVRAPIHETVILEHLKVPIPGEGVPRMHNQQITRKCGIERILDFLGSGETIITSSYHGMYWGLLMGRKVVAVPFSNKFSTFRYPVTFAPAEDAFARRSEAVSFPGALDECRDANRRFAARVFEYLELP